MLNNNTSNNNISNDNTSNNNSFNFNSSVNHHEKSLQKKEMDNFLNEIDKKSIDEDIR